MQDEGQTICPSTRPVATRRTALVSGEEHPIHQYVGSYLLLVSADHGKHASIAYCVVESRKGEDEWNKVLSLRISRLNVLSSRHMQNLHGLRQD